MNWDADFKKPKVSDSCKYLHFSLVIPKSVFPLTDLGMTRLKCRYLHELPAFDTFRCSGSTSVEKLDVDNKH